LQYLSEAYYFRTQLNEFPPKVAETVMQWARDRIDYEQYVDFLRNQTFRQTLLCHQDITLRAKLEPEHLSKFYVASLAKPASPEPDIRSTSVAKFQSSDGASVSTDHPVSKAVLLYLGQAWPKAIRFDTLLTAARAELGLDSDPGSLEVDRQALATNILTAYGHSGNLVELHAHAPPIATVAAERPLAYPMARFQARERETVTNLRHTRIRLDRFARYVLLHLDGHHNRQELVARLMAGPVAEGTLKLEREEQSVTGSDEIKAVLSEEVENSLRWLARAALLCPTGDGDEPG